MGIIMKSLFSPLLPTWALISG